MSIYLISLNINANNEKVDPLVSIVIFTKIATGVWHSLSESSWLIKSDKTTIQIANALGALLNQNDELIVIHLSTVDIAVADAENGLHDWLEQSFDDDDEDYCSELTNTFSH